MPPVTTDTPFTTDDERDLALYIAVLKSRADGIPEAEIARDLFGIDAAREPERAHETVETWHRRALALAEPASLRQIAGPDSLPSQRHRPR